MSDNIDVLIYKPTKSAMQSGLATNKFWILKFISYSKTNLDPLMGWSGSDDTSKQIVLKFNSKEEAIDYADLHSLKYKLQEYFIKILINKIIL